MNIGEMRVLRKWSGQLVPSPQSPPADAEGGRRGASGEGGKGHIPGRSDDPPPGRNEKGSATTAWRSGRARVTAGPPNNGRLARFACSSMNSPIWSMVV